MNQLCKNSLLGVIESQIIPRLIDSHPGDLAASKPESRVAFSPSSQEIENFAMLCAQDGPSSAHQYLDHLERQQVASEDIFVHLIAPAARHLGWLWEQDLADFSQVTLGLVRLQQAIHQLGYAYQSGPQGACATRRLMIACAPGSQHILGLVMVAELFRKAGWHVVVEIASTQEGLFQAVKNEWFDLIGLSVGLTEQLCTLPGLIDKLKAASKKPQVPVILGGAAFMGETPSAASLGADGISTNALDAVSMGAALLLAA
jgi:methanogenic corrinoid protein MtbC1